MSKDVKITLEEFLKTYDNFEERLQYFKDNPDKKDHWIKVLKERYKDKKIKNKNEKKIKKRI
jgi:hypothetical protein